MPARHFAGGGMCKRPAGGIAPTRSRFWRRAVLVLIGLVSSSALAQERFQPERYPFTPALTTNNEREVCGSLLDWAMTEFRGSNFRIDPADNSWPGAEVRWIFSPKRNPELRTNINDALRAYITVENVDLDESGMTQQLVLVDAPFNWQGDWHTLLRVPADVSVDDVLARGQGEVVVKGDYVIGPPPYGIHNVWYDPRVAQIGRFYYVLDVTEGALVLYRIRSTGPLEAACKVPLISDDSSPLGPLSGTGLEALFNLLERIAGGDNCGTLHPGTRLAIAAAQSKSRSAFRPWSLHDGIESIAEETYVGGAGGPYNDRERIDRFLATWADESLSNFRLYRDLAPTERAAIAAMATYYSAAFGVSDDVAHAEAARVTDQVIRRHFVFPANNEPRKRTPLDGLHRLVLDGGPIDEIDRILTANPGIDPRSKDPHSAEPLLFFALEHPALVTHFLDTGYSANESNWFGKFPLMYAAQFNLPETVRLLLKRDADPNARLTESPDWSCQIRIFISGRTPLMYAAESGSLELIRLLVEYGADARAMDTGKHSVLDYLQRNRSMSEADRAQAERLLTIQP
jgi:hypothetical protein